MANCYERKPVVVATAEVPENLQLTKRNMKKYFEVKEVDSALFTDDTVVSLNDVEGLYLQENIHVKEILSKKSLVDTVDLTADLVNPVKVSFSVGTIQNAAAGRIRTGQEINVYKYESSIKSTEKILEGLYVQEAYDSEGNMISSSDSDSIAVTFTVLIEGDQKMDRIQEKIRGKRTALSNGGGV